MSSNTCIDAVDHVRRGEHRALKRAGDARLTGSKYLWLRRPEDLSDTQRAAFRALQRQDLKVGRAWALKERSRTFWEYRYPGAARTFFAPGSGALRTAGSSPWRPSPS